MLNSTLYLYIQCMDFVLNVSANHFNFIDEKKNDVKSVSLKNTTLIELRYDKIYVCVEFRIR